MTFKIPSRSPQDSLVRESVRALADRGEVTFEEWDQKLNGYERDLLIPRLSDSAFLQILEKYMLPNCSRPPYDYDGSVVKKWAPDLVRRLKRALGIPEAGR